MAKTEVLKVNADPTKEFFISMLTRDISTDRAILDLIDNSIDAANANNKRKAIIRLLINESGFSIFDNAGGLDLDVAKNYAFRFGRSSANPLTPNSVGQFGVGMKRTLFKIADTFYVESKKSGIAYRISVDIAKWKKVRSWDFTFEYLSKSQLKEGETNIVVTKLRSEASDLFSEPIFITSLSNEIGAAYFKQIHAGIQIEFNGRPVQSHDITVKTSPSLSGINQTFSIGGVDVKLLCGVADRDLDEGGWYVICNGRMVAEADQSDITGWGTNGIPKYHADFAFFRGIVEFSCSDSSKLPWTTTKTGVDRDSKVFKGALHHMSLAMKPIIGFLRDRAQEVTQFNNGEVDSTPLDDAIKLATKTRLYEIPNTSGFARPPKGLTRKRKKTTVKVQYEMDIGKLEVAKRVQGTTSASEVGRLSFEYYFQYECKDE